MAGTTVATRQMELDGANFQTTKQFNLAVADLDTLVARIAGTNIITAPALAIGSTPTAVATGAFSFRIAGVTYAKAAVAAGTAPGNDVIPEDLYGAVALDIGADGTLDAVEATGNATGYATAALAVAGLPAAAAGHARVGYVTAMKDNGAFTFGTTNLNAANTTVAYTDATVDGTALVTAAKVANDQGTVIG